MGLPMAWYKLLSTFAVGILQELKQIETRDDEIRKIAASTKKLQANEKQKGNSTNLILNLDSDEAE